jgi:hypothetical protein
MRSISVNHRRQLPIAEKPRQHGPAYRKSDPSRCPDHQEATDGAATESDDPKTIWTLIWPDRTDLPAPALGRHRYWRDMPVVVRSRKLPDRAFPIGPGIPTQVVEPSVSLAARLQGAAGTVRVEMPSEATVSNPLSVAGNNGPPGSGVLPGGGVEIVAPVFGEGC